MAGRTCRFCGAGPPLTREHVFPQWLVPGMGARGPVTHVAGNERVLRTAPRLDVTVRDVCAACNNGWLHDLEGAFRAVMLPALRGRPVVLPVSAQLVVATWAVKTWVLAEAALKHARSEAGLRSPDVLPYIREHNCPPDLMKVWLGRFEPTKNEAIHMQTAEVISPPRRIAVIGIMCVGRVAFHIFAPLIEGPGPQLLPTMGPMPSLAPYLRQVWPHEVAEVSWPPPSILTVAEIDRRWGHPILVPFPWPPPPA